MGAKHQVKSTNKDWTSQRTTPTPPTKGNPQTTTGPKEAPNYLHMLPFQFQVMFYLLTPAKNVSSTPHLVKALEECLGQQSANLDILDHPLLCCLNIVHKKVIPDRIFNFGFIPLFLD